MKTFLNLVLGRPRAALSPSRLLAGEVTTPYGAMPTDESVETAWRHLAGERPSPPWLLLGRRDAPSGTIWGLAWCPPTLPLPGQAEIVLPEAAWALELLNGIEGSTGWHLRKLASPSGLWAGLWEGTRCEHLQPPGRESTQAVALERLLARRRGANEVPELEATWTTPAPERLRDLSESLPEADLLDVTESVNRRERRALSSSIARIGAIGAALATVAAGFGAFQAWHAHQRRVQESRLESVRALVDRAANLESSRARLVDSLRSFQDALRRSDAPDLLLSRIAAATPSTIRLQVLALEERPAGWRLRTEARVPDWSSIQPYTQALRALPNIAKVSVANQTRQAEAVSAILELEGTWP
jgi:hypothetical protein